MRLNYSGQQIEFGDADRAKYLDAHSQKWIKEEIDFSSSAMLELKGIMLSVMSKQQLINYKRHLNRRIDRIDIKEISN